MNVKNQLPLIQLLIDWFSYRRGVLQLIKIIFFPGLHTARAIKSQLLPLHAFKSFPLIHYMNVELWNEIEDK